MNFEIPLVAQIEGSSREVAEERATEIADGISGVFDTGDATAILTTDHNLLEAMAIGPDGRMTGGSDGFEIPIVVGFDCEDIEDARERACDVADAMGEVFGANAVALIQVHPDILDRLKIESHALAVA